ncbi:hypothetical protein CCMA1212_006283 [Trichoderma ghanense]|uniref:Subtilisin-like serine protease n=1 Tax=Trichoderma ghanense TaxID=65468 RepID=A0ABY2H0Z9_9HYPO
MFYTAAGESSPQFVTRVLKEQSDSADLLPASYHFYEQAVSGRRRRRVADPSQNVAAFLDTELSLQQLEGIDKHLWLAGAKRPPTQLHLQVAIGRNIVLADRIDLHLLWSGDGKLFVKPLSRFLLSPDFWQTHLTCLDFCPCSDRVESALSKESQPAIEAGHALPSNPTCKESLRKVARGFLYTYVCLVSTESDFTIAIDKRLLPRETDDSPIKWAQWQRFVREILAQHDSTRVHPRFVRAELRLSRINAIHRTKQFVFSEAYFGGWNNYSSFFRDNLAWIAAITAYLVLILTAMQVGLATERLQANTAFQQASYAFTLLAILGPVCMVSLVVLRALIELAKDLRVIFKQEKRRVNTSTA